MKIILSGGGTLGPVVPLLAVAEAYRKVHPETKFIWIGTKKGPERQLVENYGIPFFDIYGGKWRRYFSIKNFIDAFKILSDFIWSIFFIFREKPDLLISAGGFVSVPVHWAGALLGIPSWVHQQDRRVGLANKLMGRFAYKVTTALEVNVKNFPANKTEWIGNPARALTVENVSESKKKFNLPEGVPVIFVTGGGTGAERLNRLVTEALDQWPRDWQIIHLVGRGRGRELAAGAMKTFSNYHAYDFFSDEMKDAYAVADVVVARAGFSTITELAELSKPAVLLPKAGTHQEDNAIFFGDQGAVIVLDEYVANGLELSRVVTDLMENPEKRIALGNRLHEVLPPAKEEKIVSIIDSFDHH